MQIAVIAFSSVMLLLALGVAYLLFRVTVSK